MISSELFRDRWREYGFENPAGGKPIPFTERFSECLGEAYGGIQFKLRRPQTNEPPWVIRCQDGALSVRINLMLPDADEQAWLPIGYAVKII